MGVQAPGHLAADLGECFLVYTCADCLIRGWCMEYAVTDCATCTASPRVARGARIGARGCVVSRFSSSKTFKVSLLSIGFGNAHVANRNLHHFFFKKNTVYSN